MSVRRSNTMASDKAWYFVAVGVMALGLGNSLAESHPNWLENVTGRSVAAVDRFSGQAERYLAMAQLMLGQGESGFGRAQATLGSVQARIGVMQANLARRQADMARMESDQARMVAVQQARHIRVACPRVVVELAQK